MLIQNFIPAKSYKAPDYISHTQALIPFRQILKFISSLAKGVMIFTTKELNTLIFK